MTQSNAIEQPSLRHPPSVAPQVGHAALAGLIVLLLGIGLSRFGYSPLIPALIQAGWFTPGQAAYLGSANLVGYLIGALAVRRLVRHVPAPWLIRLSLGICTASFAACGFPLGFWWYFAWRSASGVTGGLMMVLIVPAVLALAPLGQRGRVAGVVFTGVGLGITLSGTLVPWLLGFGLPETWFTFAGISILLTAVAWTGIPSGAPTAPPPPVAATAPRGKPAPSRVRLTLPIVLSMLGYGAFGAGFVPHTVFWVDYIARGLGQGIGVGGSYWIVFGVAAISGPLAMGLLADRIGFTASLQWTLLADAVFVALPLVSPAPWSLVLSSLGVGCLAAGITSLASGRVTDLVPAEHQRTVWGWMTLLFSIAYAGVAYLLSYLFARTGSYDLVFGVGAAALLSGTILELASSRLPGGRAPRPA